jgi:hypothetical protein
MCISRNEMSLIFTFTDSFQADDSTRQSQDSNYSEDGGTSAVLSSAGVGRQEDQSLLVNEDSNMSFPPISDNANQSTQDTEADSDMRLGVCLCVCCFRMLC